MKNMGKDLKGKELGVGISQRKDGYYIARFTDKYGKRRNKAFLKLKECRKWLGDSQFEDENSNINCPDNMTVNSWFNFWIDVKEKTVRKNTLIMYSDRYSINIKPIIGDMFLKDIKTIHCQLVLNKMSDKGYKSSVIGLTKTTMYNMFEYALQNDVIQKNPCNMMVKSKIGKPNNKKEALTLEEQRIFLNNLDFTIFENQFRIMLQTGLRSGELIGLKWQDIDFKKKILTVNRTMCYIKSKGGWVVGEPKSESGKRIIPLTDESIRILKNQKCKNANLKIKQIEWRDFVFLNENGIPIKHPNYDRALYKIKERTNISNLSMHILRHTFATRCIESGMKPKTLQTILGHSNISITMNLYVHTTEEEKAKEIDNFSMYLKAL